MDQVPLKCHARLDRILLVLLGIQNSLRLVLQLFNLVGHVVEGVVFQARVLRPERSLQVRMLHAEKFQVIGHLRPRHRVQQPFRRRKGRGIGDADDGPAAHAQQGIARDGIQRLNAAIHQNGQPAEAGNVKTIFRFRRLDSREEPGGENGNKNPGQPLLHRGLLLPLPATGVRTGANGVRVGGAGWSDWARFRAKPLKCMRNWVINPSATRLQAT